MKPPTFSTFSTPTNNPPTHSLPLRIGSTTTPKITMFPTATPKAIWSRMWRRYRSSRRLILMSQGAMARWRRTMKRFSISMRSSRQRRRRQEICWFKGASARGACRIAILFPSNWVDLAGSWGGNRWGRSRMSPWRRDWRSSRRRSLIPRVYVSTPGEGAGMSTRWSIHSKKLESSSEWSRARGEVWGTAGLMGGRTLSPFGNWINGRLYGRSSTNQRLDSGIEQKWRSDWKKAH